MVVKRDLLLVGGGRLVAALTGLVSIRAATTLLEPEQYGELTLFIAVQTFCGLSLINPVGQHINLHTHAWWDDGSLFGRLRAYWRYIMLVSAIGAACALFIGGSVDVSTLIFTLFAMFLLVAASTWNATLISLLNMLGYRSQSVALALASSLISLSASVALVLWHPSAIVWLFGQAIGLFFGALGARFFFGMRFPSQLAVQRPLPLMTVKTLYRYCLPLAAATGLMWVQLNGYRFLVEYYWGLAQLGLFAAGLLLANQIWSLAESFLMQFLYPLFYRRVSQYESEVEVQTAVSDLINTVVPIYFLLAGLSILAAPYLLKLLLAPPFSDVSIFFVIGVVLELCRTLANTVGNTAHVKRKTSMLIVPYTVGVLLLFSGIGLAGERGLQIYWAGIALSLGAVAMLLALVKVMFGHVRPVIDIKRCGASLIILVGMLLAAILMPPASGFIQTTAVLLLASAAAGGALLAILWKSPALRRLTIVQLRNP